MPNYPIVYLDTNVFIRGIEGSEAESAPVQRLFHRLRDLPFSAATSELTLAELLAPVTREGALHLNQKELLYLDLIVASGFFALYPVSRDFLISTAHLRLEHPQKLADAIHIVTAYETGCRYFVSYDKDGRKLPQTLEHVLPDETGIEKVLKSLDDLS